MQRDLEDLIAKLEAASGPDRALDAEICRIATGREVERFGDDDWFARYTAEERELRGTHGVLVPDYTTSLDAARQFTIDTMAALGYPAWTVQTDFRHDTRGDWGKVEITVPSREFQGYASGPHAQARAELAAAIRARIEVAALKARATQSAPDAMESDNG